MANTHPWSMAFRDVGPDFEALPMYARGTWYELRRVCDHLTGELGLGRDGLKGLARKLNCALGALRRALERLEREGFVAIIGQVLRLAKKGPWQDPRARSNNDRVRQRSTESESQIPPNTATFGPQKRQTQTQIKTLQPPISPCVAEPPRRKAPPQPPASAGGAERAVLEFWEKHTGVFPGPPALAQVRARMDEGSTAEELCYASLGYLSSGVAHRGGFVLVTKTAASVQRWVKAASKRRIEFPSFEAAA